MSKPSGSSPVAWLARSCLNLFANHAGVLLSSPRDIALAWSLINMGLFLLHIGLQVSALVCTLSLIGMAVWVGPGLTFLIGVLQPFKSAEDNGLESVSLLMLTIISETERCRFILCVLIGFRCEGIILTGVTVPLESRSAAILAVIVIATCAFG